MAKILEGTRTDELAAFVDQTGRLIVQTDDVFDQLPKKRKLLPVRFWIVAAATVVVASSAFTYSVHLISDAESRLKTERSEFESVLESLRELQAAAAAVQATDGSPSNSEAIVDSLLVKDAEQMLMLGIENARGLVRELSSRELAFSVESVLDTSERWLKSRVDARGSAGDSEEFRTDVEIAVSVFGGIREATSSLNRAIERVESSAAHRSRTAVRFAIVTFAAGIFGILFMMPLAVSSALARLAAIQRGNRKREESLGVATRSFLDTVNNELRAPLTPVLGYSEMLSQNNGDLSATDQRDAIDSIHRNAFRLSELLEDVLTILKMQTNQMHINYTEFDLSKMIREQLDVLSDLFRVSNKKLFTEVVQREIEVMGDVDLLARAFRAVVENAIAYSPPGSKVFVEIAVTGEESDGLMAEIRVTDEGTGIPAHEFGLVPRAFVRGRNARDMAVSGAGLGLTIVDYVINAHAGEWSISSEVGKGTVVTMRLPCVNSEFKNNSLSATTPTGE